LSFKQETTMNIHRSIWTITALALCAACSGNDGASVGNGPGNADGVGGREDPPGAAAPVQPNEDPAGSTEGDAGQDQQSPDAQSDVVQPGNTGAQSSPPQR
jgi:hypothetical protein